MQTKTKKERINPNKIIIPASTLASVNLQEIDALRQSIALKGLMHDPCIKDNYEIIAGKKRVLASIGLLDEIECTVYPSDLDKDEYSIISLHENLKRNNLAWYDQVTAELELHTLRQSQFGIGKHGGGRKEGWSLRDTAKELNDMSVGILSEDIRIAKAILADPNLKRIEDKTTARRVILESVKRVNQEIGAGVTKNYFEANQIYCGGSEEILKMFPDGSFDACITDPPWIEFKDASLTRDEFTLPVFKEVYRVLKVNSFLYSFVSTQDWIYYSQELLKIGFHVQKWPLIWMKEGSLSYGTRSWEYQRNYEPIILAVKGSPALTDKMLSSMFSCKVVPSSLLTHPNEKPVEVIRRLIDNCSYDRSIILDPFAGSFVVPYTCKLSNRDYIAIEKDRRYFMQGQKRLRGE